MNLLICSMKQYPSLPLGLPSGPSPLVCICEKFMLPNFMFSSSYQWGGWEGEVIFAIWILALPEKNPNKTLEGQLPVLQTVNAVKYQLALDIPSLSQKHSWVQYLFTLPLSVMVLPITISFRAQGKHSWMKSGVAADLLKLLVKGCCG